VFHNYADLLQYYYRVLIVKLDVLCKSPDNVDDMMRQFEGREEELMETLQTMEDRCIAQKARTSGHELEKEKSMAATQMSLPDPKESALELAIENHDWAAADTILTLIQKHRG